MNYQVNLQVFDHHTNSYISLESKKFIKYLGVLIDENLSWSHHMAHVASKIKPSFHMIAMIATIAAQGSQRSLRSLRAYGNIHSAIFAIVATVIAEIEKFLSL